MLALSIRALFSAITTQVFEPNLNSNSLMNMNFFWVAVSLIEGLILGMVIGVLQWRHLKQHFPVKHLWFWLTLLGFASAFGIVFGVFEPIVFSDSILNSTRLSPYRIYAITSFLFGVTGLWIGVFQMFALKDYFKSYWIWSICSGLGLGSGMFLSFGLPRTLELIAPVIDPENPYYWIQIIVAFPVTIFSYFLPALCYAYCTGLFLVKRFSTTTSRK